MSKQTIKNKFRREARQIWRVHYGPIPKGRHIHHIDGVYSNNDINNLICVTPDEHRDIHLEQGDMWAENGKWIQGAAEAGRIGGSVKSEAKSEARRDDWARLTPDERKERGRAIRHGRRKAGLVPKQSRHTIRGPQMSGVWVTSFGEFDTVLAAAAASDCSPNALVRRCLGLNPSQRYTRYFDWFFIPKGDGYGN